MISKLHKGMSRMLGMWRSTTQETKHAKGATRKAVMALSERLLWSCLSTWYKWSAKMIVKQALQANQAEEAVLQEREAMLIAQAVDYMQTWRQRRSLQTMRGGGNADKQRSEEGIRKAMDDMYQRKCGNAFMQWFMDYLGTVEAKACARRAGVLWYRSKISRSLVLLRYNVQRSRKKPKKAPSMFISVVRGVFAIADMDASGEVEANEVPTLLRQICHELDIETPSPSALDAEVQKVMQENDSDRNNTITLKEFSEMLLKPPYLEKLPEGADEALVQFIEEGAKPWNDRI